MPTVIHSPTLRRIRHNHAALMMKLCRAESAKLLLLIASAAVTVLMHDRNHCMTQCLTDMSSILTGLSIFTGICLSCRTLNTIEPFARDATARQIAIEARRIEREEAQQRNERRYTIPRMAAASNPSVQQPLQSSNTTKPNTGPSRRLSLGFTALCSPEPTDGTTHRSQHVRNFNHRARGYVLTEPESPLFPPHKQVLFMHELRRVEALLAKIHAPASALVGLQSEAITLLDRVLSAVGDGTAACDDVRRARELLRQIEEPARAIRCFWEEAWIVVEGILGERKRDRAVGKGKVQGKGSLLGKK